ncbi:MAG: phosphoribosylformylglycinamidine synthase subunit PurS [Phycisphaerales bacterium]|nr:phosphoribosylformylglycinamidine synthase subunit PurS [Phycisphaerales bacterium]
MSTTTARRSSPTTETRVHRVEVRARAGRPDARGESLVRDALARGFEVRGAESARVYLIEGSLTEADLKTAGALLLANPVTEEARAGAGPAREGWVTVEVHPQPGVMDPAAQSVREALRDLLGERAEGIQVSTGWRYDVQGVDGLRAAELARSLLANPVIHQISAGPYWPGALPKGSQYTLRVGHIAIRELNDEQLAKLSREAHLFLSPDEMRAIRDEFRALGRDPSDVELETIAQTWSEHCVHKTLKARIRYREEGTEVPRHEGTKDLIQWDGRPGHTVNADGSVTIENLLKSTVAAATFELIKEGVDWTLSVFKDNSGIIALDDKWGVCIKVETHNHPSAIEPYGGAATGAGGCIRDVIGTGLGAKPIANTDVFCVGTPSGWASGEPRMVIGAKPLPPGCIEPRRVLTEVVAGVRDYGNRMGIPTVNGAVYFDDRYVGNPLVFCGCIGLIPRGLIKGEARPGDRIIALGGRTGRDGIHGATFSSAEMEHTHADEFAHAVQIGNAIEEKRLLDAILRARDGGTEARRHEGPLFNAITDCGAGGFSSAVGEMGSQLGAEVHLERAPLKYDGLSYTEIWISEAQERMVLAVPPENIPTLKQICEEEHVELADLGHFGTPGAELILHYHATEVGRLPMAFLHDGIPTPVREANWRRHTGTKARRHEGTATPPLGHSATSSLLALLSHPNIASKHWIIRQYDHEVQGNTIIKPLAGPGGRGPGDAAVIEPIAGAGRGIAIGCGLQSPVGDVALGGDPYLMTLAAIDECIRNIVCVGGDPQRTAILDNFCWPSCQKPENLASLVRAAEGCYDGAKAYRTPFVSGKDSLNNQLRYTDPGSGQERVIEIPPTLLITGLAIVADIDRAVTMDAKRAGNELIVVGAPTTEELGASHYAMVTGMEGAAIPRVDLKLGPAAARAVAALIQNGVVASAHDCSEGGLLVAVAEMLIGAGGAIGAELREARLAPTAHAFAENPSRYVLEVAPGDVARVERAAASAGLSFERVAVLTDTGRLVWPGGGAGGVNLGVDELTRAWTAPLDW